MSERPIPVGRHHDPAWLARTTASSLADGQTVAWFVRGGSTAGAKRAATRAQNVVAEATAALLAEGRPGPVVGLGDESGSRVVLWLADGEPVAVPDPPRDGPDYTDVPGALGLVVAHAGDEKRRKPLPGCDWYRLDHEAGTATFGRAVRNDDGLVSKRETLYELDLATVGTIETVLSDGHGDGRENPPRY